MENTTAPQTGELRLANYEELLGFGLPEQMCQAILTGGDSEDMDSYLKYCIEGEPFFYRDGDRWVKNNYFTTFIVFEGTLFHAYYLVDMDGDQDGIETVVEVGDPDADAAIKNEQRLVWETQAEYYAHVVSTASWAPDRIKAKHIDPLGEFFGAQRKVKVKKDFAVNILRPEGGNWQVVGHKVHPAVAQYLNTNGVVVDWDGILCTKLDLTLTYEEFVASLLKQGHSVFCTAEDRIAAILHLDVPVKNPKYRAEVGKMAQRSLDLVNRCIAKLKGEGE